MDLTFDENLIKGRIAETIFEEMFSEVLIDILATKEYLQNN